MWIRLEALNMLTGPYAEEYDASLQAAYSPRDPIAEFLRGEISCRQLRVLGQGLPETSAVVRAARGSSWTDTDYLLMTLVNETRMRRSEAVALVDGKSPRKPQLLKPPPPPEITPDEADAERARADRRRREFEAGPMAALFPND